MISISLGDAARFAMIVCLALALPQGATAQQSMAEGFSRMKLQSANRPDGLARVTFPDGSRAERFILGAGDCPASTGDCRSDRERIEFYEQPPAQRVGSETWVGWDIYLPPDFPRQSGNRPPNIIMGQFHQYGRSGPEVLFQLRPEGYEVKLSDPYRLDDDPMNPIPDFRNVLVASRGSMIGRWTRVEVNARWSRGEDGFIRIYVNGRERWSYSGATTNANETIYFKYGIYRSFVSRCGGPCPTLTAYFRNVKRGSTRAAIQ